MATTADMQVPPSSLQIEPALTHTLSHDHTLKTLFYKNASTVAKSTLAATALYGAYWAANTVGGTGLTPEFSSNNCGEFIEKSLVPYGSAISNTAIGLLGASLAKLPNLPSILAFSTLFYFPTSVAATLKDANGRLIRGDEESAIIRELNNRLQQRGNGGEYGGQYGG